MEKRKMAKKKSETLQEAAVYDDANYIHEEGDCS